jgi:adenylate kinase
MVKEWGFDHVSAGDLLREEINSGSEKATLISGYIKEGSLVPGDMIVDLLKKKVLSIISNSPPDQRKVILIDGFPRNKENLESWNEKRMSDICDDKHLLYFECSFEAMEQRIMERGKTSGRLDDNPETIKKRLHTFESETKPIVEHFRENGNVISVDAEGSVQEVFSALSKQLIKHQLVTEEPQGDHGQELEFKKEEAVCQSNNKITNENFLEQEERMQKCLPKVIFVLGGPGCGKGTQCDIMKQRFGFLHFSTGDLLREEIRSRSALADMISEYTSQGLLVPSELIVDLLRKNLSEIRVSEGQAPIVLLDGFPRNKENLDCWNNKQMQDICDEMCLLYFECSHESMKSRILERGKTSGRSDDNPETVEKRLRTFENETKPILQHFHEKGNVVTVNAEQAVEEVFSELQFSLQQASIIKVSKDIIIYIPG